MDIRSRETPLRLAGAYLLGANALLLAVGGWMAIDTAAGRIAGVAWLAALAISHAGVGTFARRRRQISSELEVLALAISAVAPASPLEVLDGRVGLLQAALGAAALALAAYRLVRTSPEDSLERRALWALTALVPLYFASVGTLAWGPSGGAGFVPGEQGELALSALWAVTGVVALVAGLRLDLRDLRVAALGLLAATIAKVFLYDLATLTSGWRIASFLALGLLLLGAGFAYQRLRPAPPVPTSEEEPAEAALFARDAVDPASNWAC